MCQTCNSNKSGHMPKKAPVKQDFVPAAMEKIACDIMGPFPETEKKNSHILVMSDYYTRYAEAYE